MKKWEKNKTLKYLKHCETVWQTGTHSKYNRTIGSDNKIEGRHSNSRWCDMIWYDVACQFSGAHEWNRLHLAASMTNSQHIHERRRVYGTCAVIMSSIAAIANAISLQAPAAEHGGRKQVRTMNGVINCSWSAALRPLIWPNTTPQSPARTYRLRNNLQLVVNYSCMSAVACSTQRSWAAGCFFIGLGTP